MQTTNHLLMVRPVRFAFNDETASNNAFQQRSKSADEALHTQREAISEFDAYVALLRENGVVVEVLQDTPEPFTPDSIFPNNCFSTHIDEEGRTTLVLYPMYAPSRRLERTKLRVLLDTMQWDRVVDLTHWEQRGQFLEGTGSFVLDRVHHVAYACRSPRTSEVVLKEWAETMGYDYLLSDCPDAHGTPVYHTNVVMNVGTNKAVACLESIRDDGQRRQLLQRLEKGGKLVVPISLSQMQQFAGNMLEVRNADGQRFLVMSKTAYHSLAPQQIDAIQQDTSILAPDLSCIEKAGGGSARCMLAELYVP
jgi:hypothetical protein